MLATVAREVAVVTLDHGQIGAHVTGEVEGGDAGTERKGGEGVSEIVDLAQRLDSGRGHIFRDDAARDATYLALGDSISIDDYTGVPGGGAPSQLARKLGVELVDLTRDGNTTEGVRGDLARAPAAADVVTLSAGGNDLLLGDRPRAILRRLHQIAEQIQPLDARVVINTVYDPSDGDNNVGRRELGLSRLAAIELRRRLNAVNGGIRKLARERGLLLADLERLFHGHGVASNEPWFVQVIEPNLAGATAIAEHWYELLTPQNAKSCEPEGPQDLTA